MVRFARRASAAAVLVVVASATSCDRGRTATAPQDVLAPAPVEPPHKRELAQLSTLEETRRAQADFATLPPSEAVLGPDPYRLAALGKDRLVGILRGASAVVVLDDEARELDRVAAPHAPSGLAVSSTGDVLVVGDGARELAIYHLAKNRLVRTATLPLDALALRDVALAPDGKTAYAVEEHDGRLLAISLERGRARAPAVRELGRCHGPVQVRALAGTVAVNCLLDHAIELHRDGGEVIRIRHDGPMWSLALEPAADGGLLIAIGGVEDHPLVREDGGFGYIDSYLYLYRIAPGAAQAVKLATVNSSAIDVITPKWLMLASDADAVSLTAAGYASPTLVTLTWRGGDFASEPAVARSELLPGTTAAVRTSTGALIAADPLLDAWLVSRGAVRSVAVTGTGAPRSAMSRTGELLFFTTLMAPWSSSEGKLSRFTCETCHHEGYIDGRTHFTGRTDVHATTRPLYGLFNLRPYFSRALDKTMTDMVHAEFRVANRHNGRDPWFAVTRADVPWLASIQDAPAQLAPEQLREALMTFLMDFSHRANPAADHGKLTALEASGAQVLRDRCASCHAARLVADVPASLVPFERWESLVLSPSGPIVWSNAAYEKTAVTPYVHDNGARVAPLRRLYKKWPYFTNGSARSIDEVLDQFAWTATATYHADPPGGVPAGAQRLTGDEKAGLRAFLDLL